MYVCMYVQKTYIGSSAGIVIHQRNRKGVEYYYFSTDIERDGNYIFTRGEEVTNLDRIRHVFSTSLCHLLIFIGGGGALL
jgi:hypothetical protein